MQRTKASKQGSKRGNTRYGRAVGKTSRSASQANDNSAEFFLGDVLDPYWSWRFARLSGV